MSVPTVSWNENSPAGSDNIALGDNRIREMKTQIREVIDVDHDFPSSGQAADVGQHKKVTLQEQADLGTGAEGTTILGSQTIDGKGELVYTDEDDNDIQLTSGGKMDLGSGRLDNNQGLSARNNAGDGDLSLIKANTSDQAEVTPALLSAGGVILPEITAPKTAANQGAIFSKNDGIDTQLFFRGESNGTEYPLSKQVADMPDGLTKSATDLSGNGSYYSTGGTFSYLVIGKDSVGRVKMTSGIGNTGGTIPLPSDCSAADCHWMVAVTSITGVPAAMSGWECSVDANRVVTVRCRSNNWVG